MASYQLPSPSTPTRSRHGPSEAALASSPGRHAPSPLRHATSASANVSLDRGTAFALPTRVGTVSSPTHSSHRRGLSEVPLASSHSSHHRRGLSEVPSSPKAKDFWTAKEAAPTPSTPESFRAALRPLQQAPGVSPVSSHSRSQSYDSKMVLTDGPTSPPTSKSVRPHSRPAPAPALVRAHQSWHPCQRSWAC